MKKKKQINDAFRKILSNRRRPRENINLTTENAIKVTANIFVGKKKIPHVIL